MMTQKDKHSNNQIHIIDVGLASKSLVELIKENSPAEQKDQVVYIDLNKPSLSKKPLDVD